MHSFDAASGLTIRLSRTGSLDGARSCPAVGRAEAAKIATVLRFPPSFFVWLSGGPWKTYIIETDRPN